MLPRDRRATAAVAVQFAVNGAFFASFLPRLPELRDRIDVSTEAIGVLLTLGSASGLLASLTVRPVIARFGTRLVLFGGGVAIALALVVVGAARSWPVALAGLAAMFAFDVYVDVAMNLQGSWLSSRRARPIMNRLHGLWSLGSVIGGLVAASLAESAVALPVHLAAAAGVLVLLSSVLATQLLPTDPEPEALDPDDSDGADVAVPKARFFVAGLTAVVIETAAVSWAAFRITDDLGGSTATGALAYVAVVGGMTVGRFAGDHLAHWWGADRLMSGSAVLAVAGLVTASAIGLEAVSVAAFVVAGLGIAALAPRLYDLAARAGAGTASGLGVLTAGVRTSSIVAPALIAAIASVASVGTAIAVAAVTAGAGFLASIGPLRES
jgi:fucose permease